MIRKFSFPGLPNVARLLLRLGVIAFLLGITGMERYSTTAYAQQTQGVALSATIGFDNNVKPDTWVPVHVQLENTGPGTQGYVQVNFPNIDDKNIYRYPVDLPSGARKELTVYAYMPPYAYEAEVAFYSRQQRQTNTSLQINLRNANDWLFGIIAGTPSTFNVLNLVDPVNGSAYTAEVDLQEIPEFSHALESLDAILISNVDSGVLSQAQLQSLEAWITSGGRLFIFGGPEWKKTTAGFSNAKFLPFIPTGTQLIQDWQVLTTLASSQVELSGQGTSAAGSVAPGAEIIAATASGLPLIVMKSLGAGEVFYFTVDPASAPLDGWPGMESIYRYLLSQQSSTPPWQHGITDWYSALNAAQTLPNLSLPSAALVCGFLMIYMIVLGPVNYLIVRKLKRRELGWFTTPGLIILFSLLVLVSGGLSRSRQPILNRLSVLQIWPGASLARLDSILGIYSPFRSTFQLDFGDNILAHGVSTGMTSINRGAVVYQNGKTGYISDLRVEVSSIEPISLEGYIPAPDFEGSLTITIDANGAQVNGSVTNRSGFAFEEAALMMSGGAIKLGAIQPGETREVSQALNRSIVMQPSIIGSYPAKPTYSLAGPLIYPSYNYLQEYIVGTNNFYSSREVYRKYSLVSSVINYNSPGISLGNEIYLSGWSTQPVLHADLHSVDSDIQDTTLMLVRFDPEIKIVGDEIKISTEFFSWSPLDVQSSSYSPYQLYFYGLETYGFAYKPILEMDYFQVSQLILHLESSGRTGPVSEVEVHMWNVELEDWEKMQGLTWGDNQINEPQQFVHPDGTIKLQLQGVGQYTDVTRADFTLIALPVKK